MSILSSIKNWFITWGNLTQDLIRAEAYIKSLESGEVITKLKADIAALEAKAKADAEKVEAVLSIWRDHAISLEQQLKEKV